MGLAGASLLAVNATNSYFKTDRTIKAGPNLLPGMDGFADGTPKIPTDGQQVNPFLDHVDVPPNHEDTDGQKGYVPCTSAQMIRQVTGGSPTGYIPDLEDNLTVNTSPDGLPDNDPTSLDGPSDNDKEHNSEDGNRR